MNVRWIKCLDAGRQVAVALVCSGGSWVNPRERGFNVLWIRAKQGQDIDAAKNALIDSGVAAPISGREMHNVLCGQTTARRVLLKAVTPCHVGLRASVRGSQVGMILQLKLRAMSAGVLRGQNRTLLHWRHWSDAELCSICKLCLCGHCTHYINANVDARLDRSLEFAANQHDLEICRKYTKCIRLHA